VIARIVGTQKEHREVAQSCAAALATALPALAEVLENDNV